MKVQMNAQIAHIGIQIALDAQVQPVLNAGKNFPDFFNNFFLALGQ